MLNQDSLSRARTLSLCLSVSVFVSVSLSVSVSPPLPLSLCRSVTLCLSPSLPRVVQQDSTPSVDHEIAHQHIAPYGCTLSLCLSVSLSLCLSVPLSLEWCNRSPAHCPIWLHSVSLSLCLSVSLSLCPSLPRVVQSLTSTLPHMAGTPSTRACRSTIHRSVPLGVYANTSPAIEAEQSLVTESSF